MATGTGKKRGRPADPNKVKKERKEATGRKYKVVPADLYEAFLASLPEEYQEFHQSKEAAFRAADKIADAADEAGQPNIRLAIFEEAGVMQAQIEKKVNRNFLSSRTINRTPKAENATESQATNTTGESTTEEVPAPTEENQNRSRRNRHS